MTYDVRPKRKNRVFEKNSGVVFLPQCGVIFLNLSEESKTLFLGAASRMF